MEKLFLIVFLFVVGSSLFSTIVVCLYDFRISDLILSTKKEDIMKYQRLNDVLLSPLKRMIIVVLGFDLFTSTLFLVINFNLYQLCFKLPTNKIAVQSKSNGGYGGYLIELMLSVFIKLVALIGVNYFTYESYLQIEKILSLYMDELDQTQKDNLDGLRIYVYMLFVSGIVMTMLYVIMFFLKFLILRKNNKKSISVSKGDSSSKFNSYQVIQSSNLSDK